MHDGNHGSFSKYPWVNKLMGGSIYILAGNVFNWKIQHNLLHHTYTNIKDHDEDLEAGVIAFFETCKVETSPQVSTFLLYFPLWFIDSQMGYCFRFCQT